MAANEEGTENPIAGNINLNKNITTRRSRNNNNNNISCTEVKDQENVNNTKIELEAEQSLKEESAAKNANVMESKQQSSTPNINSSTPRRKKDPLANLHSNLSPKYIGFTTPPTQEINNSDERSRSLRRRHNINNSDTSIMSTGSPFTPNNDSTLGFVRRTPKDKDSLSTPENSRKKYFVSPIDKLLIKNGSVVENNKLPLEEMVVTKMFKKEVRMVKEDKYTVSNEYDVSHQKMTDNPEEIEENYSKTSDENEENLEGENTSILELDADISEKEDNFETKTKVTFGSDISKDSPDDASSNQDDIEMTSNYDEETEILSNQEEFISNDEIISNDENSRKTEVSLNLNNPDKNDNNFNYDEDLDKTKVSSKKGEENQDETEDYSNTGDEYPVVLVHDENTDKSEVKINEDEMEISSIPDEETEVISNHKDDALHKEVEQCNLKNIQEVDDKYENRRSNVSTNNGSNIEHPNTAREEQNVNNSMDSAKGPLIPKDPEKIIDNLENLQGDEGANKSNVSTNNESVIEFPDNATEEQNVDKMIVKLELDSIETESNTESVEASTSAKSPSAISIDSAKGSSILNEGSWMSFSTGDLFWGQIYNYCYWPCLVCPDPDGRTITTDEIGRSGDQHIMVHVRFFADSGRRNWVKCENLMPYTGIENYQERLEEAKEKYGSKSAKFKLYIPTKKKEQVWHDAVKEANIVSEVPYADRLEKFYELFEKSKAFIKLEKQRRKSMYLSTHGGSTSDIESYYGSNENINTLTIKQKRERSISPYSPAYSPIKTVKRRKLSEDHELPTTSAAAALNFSHVKSEEQQQQSNELNLSQTNSIASSSSTPNALTDLEMYNGVEFKKFYSVMKDFVMEQNHNDKLEKSLVVAVRNIWALKQLSRHQMERKVCESLTENDLPSSYQTGSGGSVKRLSTRLKTLLVRKSLLNHQTSLEFPTTDRAITPKSTKEFPGIDKAKKPSSSLNRPILEVIDDIFELDNKYLFKGTNRDPVCKYCFKPGGNLKRCAKNCNFWLHGECLHKDFTINGKSKRSIKRVNSTKSNNDTMDGSNSSPSIELTSQDKNDIGSVPHVTGDSEGEVVCKECSNNEPVKCMVCKCTESKKDDDPLVKCTMSQCDRAFHPACCKYWPQSKITISKNHIESFRCPSHVCHTCVSDDPKGKFQHLSNAKLTKCVKCPATFHTDSTCIPAGSQILTAANIICPRHTSQKHDMTVNVNWCFICVGGGQVVCCETCPTAVHAQCLKIPIAANEGYICEECESGRMPLYGEMVWAKFNNFRWWPAIILPPTEIPQNIARKTHNPSDFVVRFFGTHDHGWISRRRVYLYLEGDSSEPPRSKTHLDLNYKRGVEEAKEVYEIIKEKKLHQRISNEDKEKLHPQPYVRIKANRAVPPVKLHIDIDSVSKCECDPKDENPCGPDTNCLNRVLYHECNAKICPAGERCQNQMFESRISPRLDVVYLKERGFGLVCREPIYTGTFVIEYVGEIINDQEFQARMQQKSRDRDENFYFLSVEKDYIIDAGPKGNLARFMNHSCDPNCETQKWSVNSLNRVGLFAIRDIPANTELTFNYHWDDLLGNEKKTCYCGAKRCAGQIGAKLKDIETTKEPSTTSGSGKNKNKTKIKTKPVKRLAKVQRGRPKLTLNVKNKSKKIPAVAAVSALLEAKQPNRTFPTTIKDDAEDVEAASSSNRTLQSPDLFCNSPNLF